MTLIANMASPSDPIVDLIDGVWVVRDDLFPGGTKARFAARFFDGADEVVYGSPCEGGAQTALATVGAALNKRVTIFCAKRARPHPRSLMAKRLGANVIQVAPGYLSVVKKRSYDYAKDVGARLLPFGLEADFAIEAISEVSSKVDLKGMGVEEVWCAGGSGVLARGLKGGMNAFVHVVQIGRALSVLDTRQYVAPWRFEQSCSVPCPFPSDPHYDAKAWAMLKAKSQAGPGKALFWNVAPPAF